MKTEQTFGQRLVRTSFNPSAESKVDITKQMFAGNIDFVKEQNYDGTDPERLAEFERAKDFAISYLEGACMYAVKMLTTAK